MARELSKAVIRSLSKKDLDWDQLIVDTVKVLKKGGIIAVPTDTVYGLASLVPYHKKLYDVKKRNELKPLALSLSSASEFSKYCQVTVSESLLNDLLPGPVTLVFQRSPHLLRSFNPDTELVGIRIPHSKFIRALTRACEEPLALTSANVSDTKSSLSIQEFDSLWPELDIVIDGGDLIRNEASRSGSTVIDLSAPGFFRIIREGCALDWAKAILATKHGLKETEDF